MAAAFRHLEGYMSQTVCPMSLAQRDDHVTEIQDAGSICGWVCKTCGKTSRHLLPYYRTVRNARAHEAKTSKNPGRSPARRTIGGVSFESRHGHAWSSADEQLTIVHTIDAVGRRCDWYSQWELWTTPQEGNPGVFLVGALHLASPRIAAAVKHWITEHPRKNP